MSADRSAYDWLKKELSQYCDRVLEKHYDYGLTYAIACEWTRGRQRCRWAAPVEEHGYREFSLNQQIENGEISKANVVRSFTHHRPVWR